MEHGNAPGQAAAAAAVALVSGGLDSGVACALHLESGGTIRLGLFCCYGQRAAGREESAARNLADQLRFPLAVIDLPWLVRLGSSGLLDCGRTLPDPERDGWSRVGLEASARAVWVPARNAVFVAIAAAHAEGMGVGWVLAGFNREEAATFPDNSPAFVAAANGFLAHGTRSGVRVAAPTADLDKAAIAAHARRLALPREWFWSCYLGGERACGLCESCRRSERAWRSTARSG